MILEDEYTDQEQRDAERVIAWLAERPWCTGAVGMIGVSWGGFAALQMAARAQCQLRGVVAIHASDDRYADDVHYIGGCVSAMDMPQWATSMLAYLNQPPDPAVVGDGWREAWLERLDGAKPFIEPVAEPSAPRRLLAAGLCRASTTARSAARCSPSAAGATATETWCFRVVEHVSGRSAG